LVKDKGRLFIKMKTLLDISEETYYFELERKEKINTRLTIPLTIFFFLMGVLGYFLQHIDYGRDTTLLFALLSFAIINVIFEAYFLIKILCFYKYAYLAKLSETARYHCDVEKYYGNACFSKLSKEDKESCIKKKFEDYILKSYIKCSDINTSNNDKKNMYLVRAFYPLFGLIIFLLLAFVPFSVRRSKFPEIQKIEVINFNRKEVNMTETKKPIDKETQPEPVVEPKTPDVRLILENASEEKIKTKKKD
jgi:hypothetical protein